MKKALKILCIIITISMICSMFTSCNKSKEISGNSTKKQDNSASTVEKNENQYNSQEISKLNYNFEVKYLDNVEEKDKISDDIISHMVSCAIKQNEAIVNNNFTDYKNIYEYLINQINPDKFDPEEYKSLQDNFTEDKLKQDFDEGAEFIKKQFNDYGINTFDFEDKVKKVEIDKYRDNANYLDLIIFFEHNNKICLCGRVTFMKDPFEVIYQYPQGFLNQNDYKKIIAK